MAGSAAVPAMPARSYVGRGGLRRLIRNPLVVLVVAVLLVGLCAVVALAAPGTSTLSGVRQPLGGVWLDSADGGHYWDVSARGICRVDQTRNGPKERLTTCDKQSKKPTQVAVGPQNSDGTYYLYVSDMSSKSIGPKRLVYEPDANSGKGLIRENSASILGGVNTAGFFTNINKAAPPGNDGGGADAGGVASYRNSSVTLGPCSATITTPCLALYLAFLKTKKIERINFVDQPLIDQSIETISMTTDPRKGVRYGIADFRNADGTDDLYITELGGEGVSVIKDVATCKASEGTPLPGTVDPPVDEQAGCAASLVPGITTNFAQGITVQKNPDGTGRYLYVGDTPGNTGANVLRYHPATGFQDVVSSSVTPYDSLLNPGETVSTYTAITGLAVNPHNGDVYVADDPIQLNELLGESAVGHIFRIEGDSTGTAVADCVGTATKKCNPPTPPGTVTASLFAYGITQAAGGLTFLPSDDGGHIWAADEHAGFCRFDTVQQAPALVASNPAACDGGLVLGSGGQSVYDDTVVPGTTNDHYVYVAQNDVKSLGVIRFTFDPSADNGAGNLLPNSGVVMAPAGGLALHRDNSLALGPCRAGSPDTCTHALYVGGLRDGFIRRINNPEGDPLSQTVDIVAVTALRVNGTPGRGINGSMGILGDDLYLPEDAGFTVVKNVSTCGVNGVTCGGRNLNIGIAGGTTGSAIAVDPNPQHSSEGLVYASSSPGGAQATIYQYDVATNTARLIVDKGRMPAAGTAAATDYCSVTCTRPADPKYPLGQETPFRFATGLYVDPTGDDGTLYITDDRTDGKRAQRGHIWAAPFNPYPGDPGTVPLEPASAVPTCAVDVVVPPLPQGDSYWVQFTSHGSGPITATWQMPTILQGQLVLRTGSPLSGEADPVHQAPPDDVLARQESGNLPSFLVTTGTGSDEPAGTYTAQFYNAGGATDTTHGEITYNNTSGAACPAGPLTGHVVN